VTKPYNQQHFQRVRWSIYTILVVSVFFHRMAPAVVSADLMASFNTSAAALGSLVAAPLAYLLRFWTWREIFVAIGLFSLLLALLSLLFVRNRPQEAGFPSLREMAGEAAHAGREQHWLRDLRDVWRNRLIWPGFWLNFGMAGGLFSFAGLWAIPLLRDLHGLSTAEASSYTTLTLFSMALSTFALGWLSDTLGRRKPVAVVSAVLYLLTWLLVIVMPWQPGPLAMLLFALLGLSGGGFVLTYACAKEVAAPALSGMAISVVNTGLFLGAAIMQPLFGWVLDRNWDGSSVAGVNIYSATGYQNGMWLMAGFALIALLASLRIRETWAGILPWRKRGGRCGGSVC
jgi:sugar phosphate permease